jgi:uncharacterized membrane protein
LGAGVLKSVPVFLLLAFLLGVVSGLRTFTAPAVLWIMRHGGFWSYVLLAAAVVEYFFDVHPNAPPRTCTSNILARLVSGAFVGWWAAAATGVWPVLGAIAGGIGAVLGAYGSLAVRKRAIAHIGNLASGLLEDVIAIAVSVAIVAQL